MFAVLWRCLEIAYWLWTAAVVGFCLAESLTRLIRRWWRETPEERASRRELKAEEDRRDRKRERVRSGLE